MPRIATIQRPPRLALASLALLACLATPLAAEARGNLRLHTATRHTSPADTSSASPSADASPDPWGASTPAKAAVPASSNAGLQLLGGFAVMVGGLVVIVRGLRARS